MGTSSPPATCDEDGRALAAQLTGSAQLALTERIVGCDVFHISRAVHSEPQRQGPPGAWLLGTRHLEPATQA